MSQTANYTTQGGDTTVIGGELVIEKNARLTIKNGATIDGLGDGEMTLGNDITISNIPKLAKTATNEEIIKSQNALISALIKSGLMATK